MVFAWILGNHNKLRVKVNTPHIALKTRYRVLVRGWNRFSVKMWAEYGDMGEYYG
jgi:hypothetical protein